MKFDPQKPAKLHELLTLLMDGNISPEQLQSLRELLSNDPQARQYYAEFMALCANLRLYAAASIETSTPMELLLSSVQANELNISNDSLSPEYLESGYEPPREKLREIEQYAQKQLDTFLAQQPPEPLYPVPAPRPWEDWNLEIVSEKLSAYAKAVTRATRILAFCSIMFLGLTLAVWHFWMQRPVATLVDSAYAQWENNPEKTRLRREDFNLQSGFARIALDKGAQVILQAPCRFTLLSPNSMFLESGSVTAKIPKQATGFTIETPFSQVVDFGTEFGLSIGRANTSELHVFEGYVQLNPDIQSENSAHFHNLKQGQTASTDSKGMVNLGWLSNSPSLFMRTMPDVTRRIGIPGKTLDLADIVGGGNGFGTGTIDKGVNPSDGTIRYWSQALAITSSAETQYIEVLYHPYIDGVFVPNSQTGPNIITSTGLEFSQYPKTTGNFFIGIFNGAKMISEKLPAHQATLNDREFGTVQNPAINMHANSGITFDLDAIRQAMPEAQLSRFTSLFGLSQTVSSTKINADFWVLVDGNLKFHSKITSGISNQNQIDVKLNKNDRFLTLSTTDDGENNSFVWSFFAEPTIELSQH